MDKMDNGHFGRFSQKYSPFPCSSPTPTGLTRLLPTIAVSHAPTSRKSSNRKRVWFRLYLLRKPHSLRSCVINDDTAPLFV